MEVGRYADLLGKLKPAFIHHPELKRHLKTYGRVWLRLWRRPTLTCQECAVRQAMIISQPASHLLGILTAIPGIRLRPARSTGGCRYMRSHQKTRWHSTPATGTSRSRTAPSDYNYYTWNKMHRGESVAKLIKNDPVLCRARPSHWNLILRSTICPVGGVILFSGAQMHSSVPNTSGFTPLQHRLPDSSFG